jgi:hypothetical protein
MSDHSKGCYLLFKSDGSGLFPTYRTSDGKLALLLFTSAEKAQAFAAGLGMSQEWQVAAYGPGRFVEWVREAVKRHGAAVLAVDPDPAGPGAGTRIIPIIPFLIGLEADRP